MQKEAAWHDCPKHLPSWTKLLNMIADEGMNIVDPFLGSGTTGIACHKLKMNFTGYEIDKTYYDKACKRINHYTSQLDLFG